MTETRFRDALSILLFPFGPFPFDAKRSRAAPKSSRQHMARSRLSALLDLQAKLPDLFDQDLAWVNALLLVEQHLLNIAIA